MSNATTSNSTTDLICPLCTEELSLTSGPHRALGLQCCGQMVCQTCLYRHIKSVWEEGLHGQGRTLLLCPMGCAHELTDKTIRSTVIRQNPEGLFRALLGPTAWCLHKASTMFLWKRAPSHDWWRFWAHSSGAQIDLEKYEQWSLTVALRRMEGVQSCPAPDCGYQWITNPQYKKHKQLHERQVTYLWYSPPKPENVPYNWVEAEYLSMDSAFIELDTRDGRRMVCPKCHVMFCGLCRHAWEISRSKSHAGRSCAGYAHKYASYLSDPDFALVGQLHDCRSCPGCSLRTNRTEGCNHMTCPCGTEWCYMCEGIWNPVHYNCTERRRGAAGSGCVVM